VTRTRVSSLSNSSPSTETASPQSEVHQSRAFRGHPPEPAPTLISGSPEMLLNSPIKRRDPGAPRLPFRKSSAAEQILEKLQSQPRAGTISGPRTSPMRHVREDSQATFPRTTLPGSRRNSLTTFFNFVNPSNPAGPLSPVLPRPRFSRSPSAPHAVPQIQTSNSQGSIAASTISVLPDLLPLLDGEHHTDELATRFEVGWPLLEQWLIAAGGGKGDGDFGRVLIIHR